MNHFKTRLIALFSMLFLFFATEAFSQEDESDDLPNTGTLTEQFDYLKESSNTYRSKTGNSYKVVNERKLDRFWQSIQDSISATKKDLDATRQSVSNQQKELGNLKAELNKRDESLQKSYFDSTHIAVLGINLNKETFVYIFWGIIFFLLLLLAVTYLRFKSSNNVTEKTKRDYKNVVNELEDFRKRTREREMKLRRELQTERNTIEELNQMIASQKR